MRVALVHDFLREYGGAERVVEALHELYPDAPLYVAFYDEKALGEHAIRFAGWDIRQSVLARFPLWKRLFSPYRVFAAWAFERLNLKEYDLVISSTNMYMAKAVNVRRGSKHLSYIHTPPRSLYGYTTMTNWKKNPFIRVGGELLNFWMRYVDAVSAQKPHMLIANSRTTQERIRKFYRRDATVVYPPVTLVDEQPRALAAHERSYALFVGRLAHSKHPEVALKACMSLGIPLKVVGVGALLEDLRAQADESVEFCGAVPDDELRELYQHAKVVLFPAEDEDFGIVPIEAMACGTPVIAHFSGEPRYTVEDRKTGLHVQTFRVEDWAKTLRQALDMKWDHQAIQASAQQFSKKRFQERIQELATNVLRSC